MRTRGWLTPPAVLAAVLLSAPTLTADDGPDAATRALLQQIREAQKGLQTARAKCEITSEYPLIERSVLHQGTVAWRRDTDGTVRQRWDLATEPRTEEDKPVPGTLLVAGDQIVYLENDKVTERGPLRATDVFHHPALGGLVFTPPPEELLKDPEFVYKVYAVGKSAKAGPEPVPEPSPEQAEPGEPVGTPVPPGTLYVLLRPRRSPWTDVLEQIEISIEPGHGSIAWAIYRENNRNEYTVRFSEFEANPKFDEHFFDLPPQ